MRLNHRESLSGRLESLLEKMPEPRRQSLRELIESLLEPSARLESLKRLEEKYILALQDETNIVSFSPVRGRNEQTNAQTTVSKPRRYHLKVPCLIESASIGDTFRMAFELHLHSSRNVFLSWRDIDPSARSKPDVLKELVACTIFIPDITAVPLTEQKAILDVIRDEDLDKPHFIGGTVCSYLELKSTSEMLDGFVDTMSQAFLKVTKPVSHYKKEGLIRFFIESLI